MSKNNQEVQIDKADNVQPNSDKSDFTNSKNPNSRLWIIFIYYCLLLGIIVQIIQSFITNENVVIILLSGLASGLVFASIPIIIASLHRLISKKESSHIMFVLFYIISTLWFLMAVFFFISVLMYSHH